VLEKKGLTESEYTLSETEELESTKNEAPYYWRVYATDGASNIGNPTGAGTFYVGFSFEFSGWLLYTVIGIGGVLLFLIGLLVGRRTTYYAF